MPGPVAQCSRAQGVNGVCRLYNRGTHSYLHLRFSPDVSAGILRKEISATHVTESGSHDCPSKNRMLARFFLFANGHRLPKAMTKLCNKCLELLKP